MDPFTVAKDRADCAIDACIQRVWLSEMWACCDEVTTNFGMAKAVSVFASGNV